MVGIHFFVEDLLPSASASEMTRPICKIPESISGSLFVLDMVKKYERLLLSRNYSKLVKTLVIIEDVGYLDLKTQILKR